MSTHAHTLSLCTQRNLMRQGVTPTPVCSPASPRITCAIRAHTWSQPHPSPLLSPQQSCCALLYSFTVGGGGVLLSVICQRQLSHTFIWIRSNCFWMLFSFHELKSSSTLLAQLNKIKTNIKIKYSNCEINKKSIKWAECNDGKGKHLLRRTFKEEELRVGPILCNFIPDVTQI